MFKNYFMHDDKTYFNLSDCHYEFEGHAKIHQKFHEIDVNCAKNIMLTLTYLKMSIFLYF